MNSTVIRSTAIALGLLSSPVLIADEQAQPTAASGYRIEQLVPDSPFCGVHGLGVDRQDRLYAGSVVAQQIYRVDTKTGAVTTEIAPPKGQADDMEFLPDGTLVWTAISQNAVRARRPDGEIVDLATDLVSVNSIAYRESDGRLFVAQVFGGDGLWELDPQGKKPRRNILKDIGGLNGFDIGPDGMIYGPLWFKQQVVRINPDNGDMQVIAEGFHTPAAANFDSQWNLYVLDTGTGEVFKVDHETGEKTVFAQLKTSLDNLAIDSQGRIYVSNMADNAIHRIDPKTGAVSEVIPPGLSCSMALDIATDGGEDTLYLADVFALRSIDGDTGKITDIGRAHAAGTHIGYPVFAGVGRNRLFSIGAEGMQVFDRDTGEAIEHWDGTPGLQQVEELPDGDLLALSAGTRLTRLDGNDFTKQTQVADGSSRIGDFFPAGENSIVLTYPDKNQVVRLNLATGNEEVINSTLEQPMGIAQLPDGKLAVMESAGRVVAIPATASDKFSIIAENIPVGLFPGMGIQSPGIVVGADGTLYAMSDRENAIYRIKPMPHSR